MTNSEIHLLEDAQVLLLVL